MKDDRLISLNAAIDVIEAGRLTKLIDAETAINGLKALPPAQPWIMCNEQPPEVGQDILMSVGGMYTAEGCLREDGDWAQFRWNAILRKDMVTAWMPLPEHYLIK